MFKIIFLSLATLVLMFFGAELLELSDTTLKQDIGAMLIAASGVTVWEMIR